jgi:hypothetical protein
MGWPAAGHVIEKAAVPFKQIKSFLTKPIRRLYWQGMQASGWGSLNDTILRIFDVNPTWREIDERC